MKSVVAYLAGGANEYVALDDGEAADANQTGSPQPRRGKVGIVLADELVKAIDMVPRL